MFGCVPVGSVRAMMSAMRTGRALPSGMAVSGLAKGSFHMGCFGLSYSLPSKSMTLLAGETRSLSLLREIQYALAMVPGWRLGPAKRAGSCQNVGLYQYEVGKIHSKLV